MLLCRIMKLLSTTPVSKQFVTKSCIVATAVVMALTAVTGQSFVLARDYESEINAAQAQAAEYSSQASHFRMQASTLQGELDRLTAEKNAIQAQIDESQSKLARLQAQIEETKRKIAENKDALGQTIADMYIDDKISPLEMLASSKNIGEYVDKQEYRASIRDELTSVIDTINTLKKQLEAQKTAVENELKNQEAQRTQLAAKEAEQQKLVDETRGQESAYQALASSKNSEVTALRNAQAEENRRAAAAAMRTSIPAGIPGGGGYPGMWANAPIDAYVDPWGLYTRECVSYTAWKVWSTGRFVPHFGGRGNANEWPGTTSRYGISNGSTPVAGSVAIMYIGYYGHAMYVEAVNGDGTIIVSDYNLEWDGLYRYYKRSAAGLTYIYF